MSVTQLNTNPEFAAECAAIDTEREGLYAALSAARAAGLTGSDIDTMLEDMAGLDRRAAALKNKFYPRRAGRLSVALGGAILVSPTGRTSGFLWKSDRWLEGRRAEQDDDGR
jgi:hypothetical protein